MDGSNLSKEIKERVELVRRIAQDSIENLLSKPTPDEEALWEKQKCSMLGKQARKLVMREMRERGEDLWWGDNWGNSDERLDDNQQNGDCDAVFSALWECANT